MALSLSEFESLFKTNHKKLCVLANRMVHDEAAAKDIVQDVFIKIWNQKDSINNTALNTYLYRATLNASLNYLERWSKFETIEKHLQLPGHTVTDDFTHKKELKKQIISALDKLPPKCRIIFALSRFEGLKYNEIATLLEISVKTVENQMGKALQIMKQELKPYLNNELLIFLMTQGWILNHLS